MEGDEERMQTRLLHNKIGDNQLDDMTDRELQNILSQLQTLDNIVAPDLLTNPTIYARSNLKNLYVANDGNIL